MVTLHAASVVTILSALFHLSNGYFMYVASPRASTRMPPQHEFELSRSPYVAAPGRTVLHPAGFVSKPPRIQPAAPRAERYRAAAPTFAPPPAEPRMVPSDHMRRKQQQHHHHHAPEVQASYTYTSEVPKPQKPHRKVSSTVTDNEIAEMVAELEAEKEQEQKLADILPRVTFDCKSRSEGYYADMEFACEVFHYCGKPDGRRFTFFCPPGSRFNQIHMICDYDKFQGCDNSEDYYHLNDNLYPKDDAKPDHQTDNQVIHKSAPPPNTISTPHRTHYSSPRPASIPLAPVPQRLKHQASNTIFQSTSRPVKPKPNPHSRSANNFQQQQIIAQRSSEEDAIMTPAPRKRHHHNNHHPPSSPQHHVSRGHAAEEHRMPHGLMPKHSPMQTPLHPSESHRSPVHMMVDDNEIGPMSGRLPQHGAPRPHPNHHHPHHHPSHPSAHPMNPHPPHVRFVEGRHAAHSSEEFDSGFPGLPIAFQRGGTFGRPMSERPHHRPSGFEGPHEPFRMAAGSHHHLHHHHHRQHPFDHEEFEDQHFLPLPSAMIQQKPNPQEAHKGKPSPKPHPKSHPSHSAPHSSSHPPPHSSSHPPPHSSPHTPPRSSPHPPSHSRPPSSKSSNHNRDPRPRQFSASPHPNHIPEPKTHPRRPIHHAKPMSTPAKRLPRPTASDEVIKEESVHESFRAHPTSNPHRTSPQRSQHPRPHPSEKRRPEPSKASAHQEHRQRADNRKPAVTTHRPQPRTQHRERVSASSRERHNKAPIQEEEEEEEETIEYTSNMEVRAKPHSEPSPKPRAPNHYPKDAEWSVEKQLASSESREEFARTRPVQKPGDSVKATTRSPSPHNNHIRHEYKAAPTWNGERTPVQAMNSEEDPRMSETIETNRVAKLLDSSEKSHDSKMPPPSPRTHIPQTTKTMTSDNHLYRTRKPVTTTSKTPATRPSFRSTARTTTTSAPISEESSEEEEAPVPIATTSSTPPPTTPVVAPAPAPRHVASHRGIQRKRIQSSSIGGRMNNWPLNHRPSYKRKQATTTATPSEEESSEEAETTTNTYVRTTHKPRRTRPNQGRTRTRAPAIEPTETTPTSTVQTTPLTPEQPEKFTDTPNEHTEAFHSTAAVADRLDVEEKSYIR